ncbi:MAG: site-2 protease family protein [Methylophilaceae bacterium]|jgi:Zn-dependent protease|nr:site-2 protease family protein [Methylophilaceae bacterium]NDF80925.1 site-2 protease family protein [Methylophilaceae bacterium]
MELTAIQKVTVYALPIIFAITVHEAAHGYAAKHFGDLTAYNQNRISLNPLRHIDPIGTIVLPALTVLLGGVLFGWAKPVPVNFMNLRHPKKDMLWVAAAGPLSNLIMAIFWTILFGRSAYFPESMSLFVQQMGIAGISINLSLMVLNLIPLPPLDGGRIAVSLLPNHLAYKYAQVERYGFLILIILLMTHILDLIIFPLIQISQSLILWIFA